MTSDFTSFVSAQLQCSSPLTHWVFLLGWPIVRRVAASSWPDYNGVNAMVTAAPARRCNAVQGPLSPLTLTVLLTTTRRDFGM